MEKTRIKLATLTLLPLIVGISAADEEHPPTPDQPQGPQELTEVSKGEAGAWPNDMLMHPACTGGEFIEAMGAFIERDYQRAEELLLGVVLEFPDFYLGYHYLALCSTHKVDLEEARDRWLEVFELSESFEPAYYDLGLCYIALGEVEEATDVLRRGVELFAHNGNLHYNLGVVLGYQDDWEGAEEQYWLALESIPDHPQSLYNLALITEGKDLDLAIELWREYLDAVEGLMSERLYIPKAQVHLDALIDERIYRDVMEGGGE